MGRKRKTNREAIRNLGFSYIENKLYQLDEPSAEIKGICGEEIIRGIDMIADRERITRSEVIMRSLAGYWHRHHAGNYQTLLSDSLDGGLNSNANIEGRVRQICLDRIGAHGEVHWLWLVDLIRDEGVLDGVTRVAMGMRVCEWLKERNIRVFR